MFTGIIEKKAKILGISDALQIKKVTIEKTADMVLTPGQSISVDGVCSTIVDVNQNSFLVEYMPETLNKTNFRNLVCSSNVNLERSLKIGDRMDGHFVYGHVDATSLVTKILQNGESKVFSFSLPKEVGKYIVYKGSVAVNGVSLTISSVSKKDFEVSLIPYTIENTNLGELKVGNMVNIETDILARYVEKIKN